MGSFNNAPIIFSLGQTSTYDHDASQMPQPRKRVVSEPCLPERLPSLGFLKREAERFPFIGTQQHDSRSPSPSQATSDGDEEDAQENDSLSQQTSSPPTSPTSPRSFRSVVKLLLGNKQPTTQLSSGWRAPEPFQIFRAIEDKDIMFLMEVRDKAFHLLLQKSGNVTPLVHAMRLGNKEVAIVLLGAFSRWVNHLEDDDIKKPQTQAYLKVLRTNLKLAIDEGLAKSQSDLIASFMQTLIMSEGDKWVWAQVSTISLALNAGPEGKPVNLARSVVTKFATKNLGKAELIASLEDYVANATADLLVLSAWAIVLETVQGEQIPSYYFARDDRMYKAFVSRLDQYQTEIQRTCNRRLKWQLQYLRDILDGRSITYRRKLELLSIELDGTEIL